MLFWDLLVPSDRPLLYVLNTWVLLNWTLLPQFDLCFCLLLTKKVENPSNFSLDKATSLLKCLWPYIMVVLRVKIELTNNLERVMLISIHLAMMCVPGGIGHMDDRKIHDESYHSILIICFLKPLVKNINTIFNTWELN